MNISNFKAGYFQKQIEYKSFCPNFINLQWNLDSPQLQSLLSEADHKLGELNAFSQLIPDIDFFIKMHILKEANQSNKIEGTKTNMEEVLINQEDILPEKRDDWDEVHNYVQAINYSIEKLKELPISTRLICNTHKILLQGVRGKNNNPGEFRTSQNWVAGATLKDAEYIPPHHSEVNELMSDLEKFLHNKDIYVPHLIKIALIHYQFETIHPFLDGNGRMGRLLITLYLVSNSLLKVPSLYLSDFFEKNKTHYYNNLQKVRIHNDLQQWLKFFLVGIIETSESSINTFKSIIKLKDKIEGEQIPSLGSKAKIEKAIKLIRFLYKNPIITVNMLNKEVSFPITTINRLIKDFQSLGILKEFTGYKRNRMFAFTEYLELF